jgi:hypothetical protein
MSTNGLQLPSITDGIYYTEPYHLEKYVVPGAVAVGCLFIFPWYLLGGKGFGGVDLGAAVIAVLVVGHVIESLKVYQWGAKVRVNFKEFNANVKGVLLAGGITEDMVEQAKTMLFTKLNTNEISGFAWNLVRWQKMTVFAILLGVSGIEWLLFAVLAILEWKKLNPFVGTFRLTILKNDFSIWWSVTTEVVLSIIIILMGLCVYKYGRDRQIKNNNFFLGLFLKYREQIIHELKNTASIETKRVKA